MFRRQQNVVTSAASAVPIEPLVPVDPVLGSAAARGFARAVAERRFDDLLGLLGACTSVEERVWAVQVAADDHSLVEPLKGWCSAQPESGLALAAWGASQVSLAWSRRGGRRLADMRPEEREQFHETLRTAERALHRAAELSPSSPLPWMGLLRSARALQISRYEQQLRYEQAMRRNAPGLDPHQQLLQGLCAKWGGSHEEMFAFARQVAAGAPAGSPLATVLVLAHLERGVAGDVPLTDYMTSVAGEIRAIGQQSVEHPSFVDVVPDGAFARNMMCLAYSLCGEHGLSQRQRHALGGRLSAFPWDYLGDPAEVFRRASPRPVGSA